MAYAHINSRGQTYYLHAKKVVVKGQDKVQRWFAKDIGPDAVDEYPDGRVIVEREESGLLFLKNPYKRKND